MQSYEITSAGKQIARESGLESLPEHLLEINFHSPLLVQLTDEYAHEFDNHSYIEKTAIRNGRLELKNDQERLMFEKGLFIDTEINSWKRIGELAKDTLFPNNHVQKFMPAIEEDRLILSGIVGLQLVDFRQKCNLLARSRYEEYGFRSFNESCAFVGAYVMAALSDNYNERISGDIPSFTYEDNGVYHKISIGGTIHGDFKISEIKTLTSGIISPIGTETEFSPIGDMNLSAYHSVEPSIVESMLAHEFLKGDKQRLTRLIDEFMDICRPLVDHDGNVKYTVGNFGDYGQSSSISDYPISIKILLEDRKLRNEDILFGSFVDPAGSSDILFEIISLDNGIRLQNRYSNYSDTESYIDINRQHFGEIFNALLSQTQAGLGRTSPHQLIKLIIEVKKMLDE